VAAPPPSHRPALPLPPPSRPAPTRSADLRL
jgi:hypothetical protein